MSNSQKDTRVHYTDTTTTTHQIQPHPKHRPRQCQQEQHPSTETITTSVAQCLSQNPTSHQNPTTHHPTSQPASTYHTQYGQYYQSQHPATGQDHHHTTCDSALFDVPPTHHTTPANPLSASTNHHVAQSIS